jgi:exopolyphosphatase/guanosine-5'-triphosphate,3'-diphosphate pyrophosphatase
VLLRLAVLLHRARAEVALPKFTLTARKRALELRFPPGWLERNPLTQADLAQEAQYLRAARYHLGFG